MITPSEADSDSPLSPAIEQYLATDNSTARDRVRLFRLASDLAIGSFGTRQVLYERFYASDPLSLGACFGGNLSQERSHAARARILEA